MCVCVLLCCCFDLVGGLCNCLYDTNSDVIDQSLKVLHQMSGMSKSMDGSSSVSLMSAISSKLFHGKGEDISSKALQCARLLIKVIRRDDICIYLVALSSIFIIVYVCVALCMYGDRTMRTM